MLTEKITTAGKTKEVVRSSRKRRIKEEHRAPRGKKTTEQQVAINRNGQLSRATNIVNANFDENCASNGATYRKGEEPKDRKAALRDRGNWIKRLGRYCEKEGIEFKYFVVTEQGKNGRWHHHIIMPKIPVSDFGRIWGKGDVYSRDLDDSGDYKQLAEYLIKKTDWEFDHYEELKGKQRYSISKNLKKPEVEIRHLRGKRFGTEVRPHKGYRILPESVYVSRNPWSGADYIYYRMVKLTEAEEKNMNKGTWSNAEIKKLEEMVKKGMTARKMAWALCRSETSVRDRLRKMGLKAGKPQVIYGVYEREKETPLIIGTTEECCDYLDLKKSSFQSMASRGGTSRVEIVALGKDI